jgi:hypothetical protein
MTIVTQRRSLLVPPTGDNALPLPIFPQDRTPVWQRVVVVSITLALTATLGAVAWIEMHRRPGPAVPPAALIDFQGRSPEALGFAPDMTDPGEVEKDEATLLLEEVNRLLRLADALDVEIDRLAAQAPATTPEEDAEGLAKLPEAEHVAATGPDILLPHQGIGLDEAPLPQVLAIPVAPVAPGPASMDERPAERLAPVAPAVTAMAGPPAPLAFPPGAPLAETAGPAETVPGIVAAEPAVAPPPAPPVSARPRSIATASAQAPVRRLAVAAAPSRPSAAQRRCQSIAVRFQLGIEPSGAEQRFLRRSCR